MIKSVGKVVLGMLIMIPFVSSAILFGDVLSNKNCSIPKLFKYNAGSSPAVSDFPIFFVGTASTSSGVATFYLTDDGTVNGTALFSSVKSVVATASNNTGTLTDVQLSSVKNFDGKTLTVNVVSSAGILLGGQGLEFAGTGITVNVTVIGE